MTRRYPNEWHYKEKSKLLAHLFPHRSPSTWFVLFNYLRAGRFSKGTAYPTYSSFYGRNNLTRIWSNHLKLQYKLPQCLYFFLDIMTCLYTDLVCGLNLIDVHRNT